jgi:hypothetical protein
VFGATLFLEYMLPDPEHSMAARALLVLGYAAAAWVWWRSGSKTKLKADSFWWRLGAVLLFLLAVNKLFNLRLVFEAGMRALAKSGNWYDRRQPVQFVVAIVLPSLCASFTAFFLATRGRVFFRRHLSALFGWVMLLLYLILRQSQEWKPVLPWLHAIGYNNWRLALEAGGILLVVFSALISRKAVENAV